MRLLHVSMIAFLLSTVSAIFEPKELEQFISYTPEQSEHVWYWITERFIHCMCPTQKQLSAKVNRKMEQEGLGSDPETMRRVAYHHTVYRLYEGCLARREWHISLARRGLIHHVKQLEQGIAPANVPVPSAPLEFSPTAPTMGWMGYSEKMLQKHSATTLRQLTVQKINSGLFKCACPQWLRPKQLKEQVRRINHEYDTCVTKYAGRLIKNNLRGYVEGNYEGASLTPADRRRVGALQGEVTQRIPEEYLLKSKRIDPKDVAGWAMKLGEAAMPALESAKEKFVPAVANLGRAAARQPRYRGAQFVPGR